MTQFLHWPHLPTHLWISGLQLPSPVPPKSFLLTGQLTWAAGGRLLLHYPLQQPASHDRSERSGAHIEPGTVQTVTITAVHMDHLEVATDSGEKQQAHFLYSKDPWCCLGVACRIDACDAWLGVAGPGALC